MIFLLILVIPYTMGTPRPFERYLDAPVLLSVSGAEPAGLFISWDTVTQRRDDPVLGYKIRLWTVEQETETKYELLNAEEYPGFVHNIKPTKSFRLNETLDTPWREYDVVQEYETFHIKNLEYDVIYEVRVLAYKIDQDGPMSEPMRIKLVKVGDNLGVLKQTATGCSFLLKGDKPHYVDTYPFVYISNF